MKLKKGNFVIYSLLVISIIIGSTASNLYAESGGKYLIGSGDILDIMIWKEPEISRKSVVVRTDGYISFPLLNDIKTEGTTLVDLKNKIEKGLKNYIAAPIATVTLKKSVSKRFYVLGEIRKTGEYPIVKELTILQAFALAGGFTEWASKTEIILFRKEGGKQKIHRINYKHIIKGKDFSQNVNVLPDDIIIVP